MMGSYTIPKQGRSREKLEGGMRMKLEKEMFYMK